MTRIVCFHLYNDYSGSPKVLKPVLKGLLEREYHVDLVTSRGGVLDELKGEENICFRTYRYRFSPNPVVTMLRFLVTQVYTFLLAFRWMCCKDVVFYINTLLPIGPALAGRMMGKRVVYHYHENAFVKGAFYKMLAKGMQKLAHEIVCVSAYQASFLTRKEGITVIPNALPQEFVERLQPAPEEAFTRKRVLMLGSLKLYKGTLEFVELAKRLPQFFFELVVNDTHENITQFVAEQEIAIPKNLTVFPRQSDVTPFYNRASVVLNLSNKKKFLETFGLTALEAMSAALPVIVPTEGGIAEMVKDGVNGYRIDVQELDRIEAALILMLSDSELYLNLANNALTFSERFKEKEMIDSIELILKRGSNS